MIGLTDVTARDGKIAILNVRLDLAAGTTAVLGSPEDGTYLLSALIAGAKRPARGSVTVLGGAAILAKSRRAIGYVPLSPDLPEALRVQDVLDVASKIRGSAVDTQALSRFGVEALAPLRVSSLSRPQLRAVALAEAVSSPSVQVLVIEEPFVSMEPSAQVAFRALLESRSTNAGTGASRALSQCIVVVTASPSDARDLASSYVALSRGKVVKMGTSLELTMVQGSGKARLAVVAEDPRALLAALAQDSELLAVEMSGRSVVVVAHDVEAAARAVGRAVVSSGTPILELSPENALVLPPGAP